MGAGHRRIAEQPRDQVVDLAVGVQPGRLGEPGQLGDQAGVRCRAARDPAQGQGPDQRVRLRGRPPPGHAPRIRRQHRRREPTGQRELQVYVAQPVLVHGRPVRLLGPPRLGERRPGHPQVAGGEIRPAGLLPERRQQPWRRVAEL